MSMTRDVAHLFVRITAFAFLLVLPPTALAQTNKADLVGTVTDSNGAAVSGATVTITKVDTNAVRTVTTGDSGEYQAPSLDIGSYKVTVTKQGYQTVTQENIVLQTSDRLRIDLTLPPGTISGEVTVTAAAPLVESESSDRGTVGFAKPRSRFDEGSQHALQIKRRAADDLEHIGGGGLLLQGFT